MFSVVVARVEQEILARKFMSPLGISFHMWLSKMFAVG